MRQTKFVLHLRLSEKLISFTVCVSFLSGIYKATLCVRRASLLAKYTDVNIKTHPYIFLVMGVKIGRSLTA